MSQSAPMPTPSLTHLGLAPIALHCGGGYVPVGRVTLGRVMNVIGETIDDYGELTEKMLPIYRKAPSFYERNKTPVILQTGIKVIDMLAPYQRGGNIGLIGCAGVGKSILMMELMNIVADIYGGLSVFAGIKEQSQEGEDLYRRMVSDGIIKLGDKQASESQSKCAFVCGQINDPPGARSRVVYTGLTVAEGFRDEGRKVLLFVDNHFRFTQADSELSTLLGRIPSAVGYQPTLSIDIHSLQERIAATSKSFITSFHTIYPGDDVDVHLDAATVFSKEIFDRGIYPAIDPLKSTSSLLSPHCLHEDHFEVADGVIRNLQHYKNLQDIIAILGVDELSEDDQLIITRARKIELFLGQPLSVVAYPRSQETYVHLDDTLKGFQGLLDGEYDYIPDAYFHMTCGIKDVIAAYENHLLAGMQCN
ncbi:putative H(+)-transporting two-sector ATPase [Medicago truncatula]|uniref:ATP synthase subunit beta n=1 Tax=Medicago truncatula TaxID=3880 RepID=A0A396JB14_MEDTR|nr:putative H(+)-transporting two-sector ATPase [Medicago truncatula]RHN74482.1 putative H(+)-transporting two-sector ATPase [Medicago truncatula]RHN74488.1 putative H(+)-transporting two-sector ATPase [Medicago truncatula]RHN74495.1 putative H(+)-transporting two-sector ATPase [Medicago truncatula]